MLRCFAEEGVTLAADYRNWIAFSLILIATVVVASVVGALVRRVMSRRSIALPSTTIFVNLARLGVWAIGLTWALNAVGVRVSGLVAALGIAGLAVSLGLQDTLANFFAGLQIVLSKQVQPGETIRLSTGEEGVVQDVTWRDTTIENANGDLVIVPNSLFARALFTNYSKPSPNRSVVVRFSVADGTDLDDAERVARAAAQRVIDAGFGAAPEVQPIVRFRGFTDSGVGMTTSVRVRTPDDAAVTRDALVRTLYDDFRAAGISIGAETAEQQPTSPPPPPAPRPLKPPTG